MCRFAQYPKWDAGPPFSQRQESPDSVEKVPICLWSKNFGVIEVVLGILAEGIANFPLLRP